MCYEGYKQWHIQFNFIAFIDYFVYCKYRIHVFDLQNGLEAFLNKACQRGRSYFFPPKELYFLEQRSQ